MKALAIVIIESVTTELWPNMRMQICVVFELARIWWSFMSMHETGTLLLFEHVGVGSFVHSGEEPNTQRWQRFESIFKTYLTS